MLKRCSDIPTQLRFIGSIDGHARHRQFYGVLFESVDTRKISRWQKMSIYTQMGVSTRTRPISQLCVNTFAVHHQWAEQTNMLAFEFTHKLRNDALRGLRLNSSTVNHTVLRT